MGSIHEYKMLFDDGLQPIHIICSRWGQKILFLLFRHDLNVAKRCHQTDHTKSTEVQVTIFYVSVFDGMLTLNWVASSVWPHMLSSFCIVALQMLGDPWDNLLPWQRHCPAGHDNGKRLPSVPYNPCIYEVHEWESIIGHADFWPWVMSGLRVQSNNWQVFSL